MPARLISSVICVAAEINSGRQRGQALDSHDGWQVVESTLACFAIGSSNETNKKLVFLRASPSRAPLLRSSQGSTAQRVSQFRPPPTKLFVMCPVLFPGRCCVSRKGASHPKLYRTRRPRCVMRVLAGLDFAYKRIRSEVVQWLCLCLQ